jgi:hypothetical protein
MLQSGTIQKCDESKADIKITLLDNLYKGDLNSPGGNADYDYLAIGSWGKRDSDGISWWKDPRVIVVKNKNRPLPKRAVINEISNGYKQIRNIPNDAIGIICIDISSYITAGMQYNSQEFMAIFEMQRKR